MSSRVTALLDKGSFFEGRLVFEGVVRINGKIKGEIITEGMLIVDNEAFVEASIQANKVIISGHVIGKVIAKRSVTMHAPAKFRGTLETPTLQIDEGVVFEGASSMSNKQTS